MKSGSRKLKVLSNIGYTVFANFLSLLVSVIITLVLPKFIGIAEFGYWQLYVFYSLYIGFLHLGWVDGLYLRLGGVKYEALDASLFYSQFLSLMFFQVGAAVFFFFTATYYYENIDRYFVLTATCISIVFTNTRYMLLFILQASYRISDYSFVTILDRVIFGIFTVLILLFWDIDYRYIVLADLAGRMVSLLYATYLCRNLVWQPFSLFSFPWGEIYTNVRVGGKLMLSNIADKLIIGNVRFGIERVWSIVVFSKISLMLSISNFVLLFINSVSLVLFPILRRVGEKDLNQIFDGLRVILMVGLLGIPLMYFPLFKILNYWLPQYSDSLQYLVLLFPLSIYESKMSLLVTTYLKVLRKEKLLLKINYLILSVSFVLTLVSVYVLQNLDFAVASILIAIALRCILAEFLVSRLLGAQILNSVLVESLLVLSFLLITHFFEFELAFLLYFLMYSIYVFLTRRKVRLSIEIFKTI